MGGQGLLATWKHTPKDSSRVDREANWVLPLICEVSIERREALLIYGSSYLLADNLYTFVGILLSGCAAGDYRRYLFNRLCFFA